MTPEALIAAARAVGVDLEADGENIRVRPAGVLPAALRDELVAAKPAVLALLRGDPEPEVRFDVADPCASCGSTTWIVSLVIDGDLRLCVACLLGRTAGAGLYAKEAT